MSEAAAPPAGKTRDRSIEARRVARVARFEHERLIVDGLSISEIAERIGVTEKHMRALVKEILARRMPEAPEEFAALRARRLNEALIVAYSAMAPDNLKAVAHVVRIARARPLSRFCRRGRRPCRPRSTGRPAGLPSAGLWSATTSCAA